MYFFFVRFTFNPFEMKKHKGESNTTTEMRNKYEKKYIFFDVMLEN